MEVKNMISSIEEVLRENWDRKAFSDYGGESITYAEVAGKIKTFHAIFASFGLKKGDKIALLGKNCSNWAVVYFAALSYGAVIVPILIDFHPEDIQHILNHSEAEFLFASGIMFDKLDETMIKKLRSVISLDDFSFLYTNVKNSDEIVRKHRESGANRQGSLKDELHFPDDISQDDCAALVYTSGTSGFSKGVMLPYRSLMINIMFSRENMPLKGGDRILSFLPLAHAYGCSIDLLFPFFTGCHITFLPTIPSPKILLKALADIRPRLLNMVPLIIEKVYRKQIAPILGKGSLKLLTKIPVSRRLVFSKIRKKLYEAFGNNFLEIVVGGAPLNPDVENFFKKLQFPLSVGYGMTECGPLISYAPWDKHPAKSVGRSMNYCIVRIDSPDPANIAGEILVKGPNVMLGYYRNTTATEETLDSDGWLHTGDLGLMDENGFIYIKGRSKNMILGPSGQNIYPEEVENKLNSMQFVQESLVLDDENGLYALIYPNYDELDSLGYDSSDIEMLIRSRMEENRNAVNAILPSYAKIKRIELQPEPFEKTPTKKIKRFLYDK